MLDTIALRTFFPLIATPSHDGKYFHSYVNSLLRFYESSSHFGMRLEFMLHPGESLITRARNNCVAAFLANHDWTHLFWIDSDIGFSPEAAFRLLLSGYDVAAGVYPLKHENWPEGGLPQGMTRSRFENAYTRYTVNAEAEDSCGDIELRIMPDGFLRISEAPTGFMLIKRCVFERLMAAYPELQYVPDGIGDVNQGLHYRFFEPMIDPGTRRYLSEDYGFCRLWQGLGESIYIDANSNLSHQGMKTFHGDFASSLTESLPFAIGGPAGARMVLSGTQYLRPNAPPA